MGFNGQGWSLKVLLHEFKLGDVEDPEIFASQPIYEWQQTELGKWCMEHAEDIHWTTDINPNYYGYAIRIFGELEGKHLTYFQLLNN